MSGVAGPEMAVMFAEEGVNGAHQDPQYNVLYRNINMVRSFVDAAVAKRIMAAVDMAQIDGAHNANATAREAWKVMPELLVQHAINCAYSVKAGMPPENICLSTVPPDAAPAPCVRMDLPYAVALRDLFGRYKMRAQQNTRYIESCGREATVNHVLNMLVSRLTSADIQSTITPDEGRNVPWHYNNVHACNTARQTLVGLDGLRKVVKVDREAPELKSKVRELKERAVLFLEGMVRDGGYFGAVQEGYFVDSGMLPGDQRRRHRPQDRRRRRRGHRGGTRVRLHGARVSSLRRQPPARRPEEAVRPHRRLHALRRAPDPVHRRARPRGQRQRPPRAHRRGAREGSHQARGAVGGGRRRRRDDVPAGGGTRRRVRRPRARQGDEPAASRR